MGYLRGQKTKIRAEQRAVEDVWDRLHEEDRKAWLQSHDPNDSEHNGEGRLCYGSYWVVLKNPPQQCLVCNVRWDCAGIFIDYYNSLHVDLNLVLSPANN